MRSLMLWMMALGLTGCGQRGTAPPAEIWAQRCATCHGASGRGDGGAAVHLDPKPRDLTDPVWQDARDDTTLAKVILDGGAAVGRSSLMPPHPDLGPRIGELVAWIRRLRRATVPAADPPTPRPR